MRKNRENFILVNIMMPAFAERIVHPMTLAENVYQKGSEGVYQIISDSIEVCLVDSFDPHFSMIHT